MRVRVLINITLIIVIGLLVTACKLMQAKQQIPVQVVDVPQLPTVVPGSFHIESEVSASQSLLKLLRYSSMISELSGKQLVNEFKNIDKDYNDGPTMRGRFKLAVLLSRESTNFQDTSRAIKILGEVIKSNDFEYDMALQEYAHLFRNSLKMQSRWQSQSEKKYAKVNQQLDEERKLRLQLEQQLEALKNIEKTISSRNTESEGR